MKHESVRGAHLVHSKDAEEIRSPDFGRKIRTNQNTFTKRVKRKMQLKWLETSAYPVFFRKNGVYSITTPCIIRILMVVTYKRLISIEER